MASRFFPQLTASRLHLTTYLLGIALFSIAFLVFLNSSISFVITDVIGEEDGTGDKVGTLGFADELLALVACPFWGLVSDRVGVRPVAVAGYCIVGLSLICLVKSSNVYPELLLSRLVFSVGGAACSTMVTAVLPAMTAQRSTAAEAVEHDQERGLENRLSARVLERHGRGIVVHGATPSVSSEVTITPTLYTSRSRSQLNQTASNADASTLQDTQEHGKDGGGTSRLAGFVGMFTGAGALVALAVFLPLPAYLQDKGKTPADSVQTSFYIVGAIAFLVAMFVFFGLRHLPGEEDKSMAALCSRPYDESTKMDHDGNLHTTLTPSPSYLLLLKEALLLGFTDSNVGLGYVGGFVARASSVGVSLFIPFFVNAYFKRMGLCPIKGGTTLPELKKNCQEAYRLAAALSGIAETAALLCAPIFGMLGARAVQWRIQWPILVAAVVGVGGNLAFGLLQKPDPFHGEGGQWAILAVILIGISQIGSIVCSLALLGRGTNATEATLHPATIATQQADDYEPAEGADTAPLLPSVPVATTDGEIKGRAHLKGSIAGMYSFAGGAGILILTKAGGALSDSWTPGAPFFILAIFNAVLLITVAFVGMGRAVKSARLRKSAEHAD